MAHPGRPTRARFDESPNDGTSGRPRCGSYSPDHAVAAIPSYEYRRSLDSLLNANPSSFWRRRPEAPNPRPSAWQGQRARRGGDTSRVPLTLRVAGPRPRLDRRAPLQRSAPARLGAASAATASGCSSCRRLALERLEYELEVELPRRRHGAHRRSVARAAGARRVRREVRARGGELPAAGLARRADAPAARSAACSSGSRCAGASPPSCGRPTDTDPAAALPLLIAHDGPEYDRLAALTDWAGAMVAAGHLPPFRLALLPPGDRDNWYSASEGYARAFAHTLVPALAAEVAVRGPVAGMGASLGALALLHVHRRLPGRARRAVPAVRLVLHARDRPAGAGASRASAGSRRSSAACCARATTSTRSGSR